MMESSVPVRASPPTTTAIQCSICGHTFQRQEHLKRHRRIHTSEKPFSCQTCGKAFSRLDVLTRHRASHVRYSHTLPGTSSRACTECAASRVRCPRGVPCARCLDRDLQCNYPAARKYRSAARNKPAGHVESVPTHVEPSILQNVVDVRHGENGQQQEPLQNSTSQSQQPVLSGLDVSLEGVMAATGSPSNPASAISDGPHWPSTGNPLSAVELQNENGPDAGCVGDPYGFSGASLDDHFVNMSTINWMSPENQNMLDWSGQLAALSCGNIDPEPMGSQFILSAPLQVQGMGPTSHPSTSGCTDYSPEPATSGSPASPQSRSSGSNASIGGKYYVEGTAGRAPFGGRSVQGPSVVDMRPTDNDALPEQVTSAPDTLLYEDIDGPPPSKADILSNRAYENLLRGTESEAQKHSLGVDMDLFPSFNHAQHFVRLYFQKFHPTYAFLRKSISVYEHPDCWILLLAIATVGARYAHEPQFMQSSQTLFYLLRNIFYDRFSSSVSGNGTDAGIPAITDLSVVRLDLPTLQAGILYLVIMTHSGQEDATRRTLVERYHVVEACRNLNLLSSVKCSLDVGEFSGRQELFQVWLDRESRIRTGMMIWLLDSILAFEFTCTPLLKLGDARVALPCKDSVWDRPTVERIVNGGSKSVSFLEAIEMLYIEKKLPPNLGEFSTQLLIYAIYRRTKESIYQHQSRLHSWTPSAKIQGHTTFEVAEETWPPSLSILSAWRNSACDCLDILHWNANSIAASAGGWEHPTILHLHLSRLIVLTPVEHMQTLTTALSCQTGDRASENEKYVRARHHLLQWAIRDQYKARLSIIHAGALLWHVRRYRTNSFLEPYAIYIVTIAVWAYSVSVQSARQCSEPEMQVSNPPNPQERDSPARFSSPTAETEEEPEPAFIYLDRPCDDEMVQTFVRLGHKMSAHMSRVGDLLNTGAPQKILQEGRRVIMGKGDKTGLDQGRNSGYSRDEWTPLWGIERSYTELLERLARATATGDGIGLSRGFI